MASDHGPEPPDELRRDLERALGDRYRILRLLGRGGMGSVYLAREEALERLVAIKVLPPDSAQDAATRERFRREARTAASLSHPNIVPLYSFGDAAGTMYLVMGYVQGESLSARMRREGRIPPEEGRRILGELADALDYAHRRGVIHRDVKPDNVLIDDETGRATLTDFGIAKARGAGQTLTQAGNVVGTPQYMSPEQCSGEAIDGRSDLYSLGLMAYAMLSARLPFEGATPQETLVLRLTQSPAPLRSVAPEVPEDLGLAVDRCLAREPPARWPDGRSLREAVAPAGLDDDQLPEPLDALDGMGPLLLPFLVTLACGALYWWLWGEQAAGGLKFLVFAIACGLVFLLPTMFSAVLAARRSGLGARRLLAVFWRQPTWWPCFWYPRPFRRPGDVWDRLPRPFRWWRVLTTIIVAAVVASVPAYIMVSGPPDGPYHVMRATGIDLRRPLVMYIALDAFAFLVAVALLPPVALACARIVRSRGFDVFTLRRVSRALLIGPTSRRSPWKRPEIAAILLPPRGAPGRRRTPRSPAEQVESLATMASALEGPARGEAEEVLDRARAMATEIESLEREISRLQREAQAPEAERLRERLAALEGSSDPDADEMRRLLSRQLELLERRKSRCEEAVARRDERVASLQRLWSDFVLGRGEPARGARDGAAATLTRR